MDPISKYCLFCISPFFKNNKQVYVLYNLNNTAVYDYVYTHTNIYVCIYIYIYIFSGSVQRES